MNHQETLETRYPVEKYSLGASLLAWGHFDLTLVTGDQQNILAHRVVLVAASSVFRDMLAHKTKDCETTESFVLNLDIDFETMNLLIRFLYKDTLDFKMVSIELLENLLSASYQYKINSLYQLCIRQLAMNVNPSNVKSVLELAERYDLDNLYKDALEVIKNDPMEVMSSADWITCEVIKRALQEIRDWQTRSLSDTDSDLESDTVDQSESPSTVKSRQIMHKALKASQDSQSTSNHEESGSGDDLESESTSSFKKLKT